MILTWFIDTIEWVIPRGKEIVPDVVIGGHNFNKMYVDVNMSWKNSANWIHFLYYISSSVQAGRLKQQAEYLYQIGICTRNNIWLIKMPD